MLLLRRLRRRMRSEAESRTEGRESIGLRAGNMIYFAILGRGCLIR